ncbi:hypothetical protein Slin14017_G080580 [Septoria linicola]|nr:hypothetical protein Slin14017_G080580 [Septoria linicola]
MPTTEVLVCPLSAGSDIGDDQNEAAKVLKEVGDRLSKTNGVQQIQFGTQIENPGVFELLVNWESLDHHKSFMATEAYTPFLNRFLTIAGGKPTMVHADLEPAGDFSKAISAPVTEVATFYFGGDAPEGYLDGVLKFRNVINSEGSDGFLGAAAGVTHEDTVKSPKDGHEGKAAVLAIGWESVEKHMAFRETKTFKDNIHYLRNGAKEVEMHHVQFMKFVE